MNRHPSSVRTLRPPTLRNTTPNNLSGTGYSGQNPAKKFPSHSQTVKIRGSGYSTRCFSARKSAGHTVVANRPASTKAGNFRRKTPTSSLPGLLRDSLRQSCPFVSESSRLSDTRSIMQSQTRRNGWPHRSRETVRRHSAVFSQLKQTIGKFRPHPAMNRHL